MSVFASLYANQYDTLYSDKDYRSECDLIERAFGKFDTQPRNILDVGCGTGNHTIELARRGYACTGIDLSHAMLEEAARKTATAAAEHAPRWIQGDARTFDAGATFDAAVMMFAVVGYLTGNDDVHAGLHNVRRHLKPGGLFVCDFWYGPAVLSVRPSERVRVLRNGAEQTIRAASTAVDSFTHTADVSFRLWKLDGDRFLGETMETHRMRYFFPQEFKLLLEQAGFESLSLSAFPELDRPLSDESWNALSVARAR
ncbi:MAG: methyltransferase domain-containing protein [Proteobacteria bacterium]|nr:methyltransferase domain-containing protein [Pseudomonadota bacterium]